jgi:molybdopterin/thiamine biosynthesis adenylyltransferase
MSIKNFIDQKRGEQASSRPIIFDLQDESDRQKLSNLIADGAVLQVIDDYEEQLKEYFAIMNPPLVYQPNFEENFKDYLSDLQKNTSLWQYGRYVYFPWLFTLVHILDDEAFQQVRTARNKNLINDEEQKKFYQSVIGIAGLSVGNSVALAIVLQGGAKHIKLADFDRLALSNLNRIRSGVDHLGLHKVEITARQIYLLNPYAQVDIFPEGLTPENIGKFFEGPPKLDLVIDEIDNLAIKCLIREHARRLRLPVLMAADNGDNGVVDIERYDLDTSIDFFHGRIGDVSFQKLIKLDKFETGKLITKLVGEKNIPLRMKESLIAMGKTVVSWPQLGGAALLNGSAVAYCGRKILNGEPLENNRAHISLDEKLTPDFKNLGGTSKEFDHWLSAQKTDRIASPGKVAKKISKKRLSPVKV